MTEHREHVSVPWWSDMLMYWLEDQVAIAFHSDKHPSTNLKSIIESLELDDLNQFLQVRGFKLLPFNQKDIPHSPDEEIPANKSEDVNDPIGKYLFSSPSDQGTIIVGFFHIASQDMFHPVQAMTSMHGSGSTHGGGDSSARQVVNIINANLEMLRQARNIPVVAAMPNWLGGTTCFIHGCSFSPLPVEKEDGSPSQSAGWTITLPDLSDTMKASTGKEVTVFVLDTMLEPDQITKASQESGESNWLLKDIVTQMEEGSISLKYQTLSKPLQENADDQLVTGRDIYGRTAGFAMPGHGLFVTGIIHDLAPAAKIEYIRILNDFGAGDTHLLIHELEKIHKRMAPPDPDTGQAAGNLHNQPVVINLSLVLMPPRDELPELWFGADGCCHAGDLAQISRNIELLRTPFELVIQSLSALGTVIVAATGNDSNTPDMAYRSDARYPAAFPEVISVGAVDKAGNATLYSDYPASPPRHNGILTYGGGLASPVPLKPPPYGSELNSRVTATDIDSLRGVYASSLYPALSADNPHRIYAAPNKSAWACWSGTSFAAPIVSAVAARILEHHAHSVPPHLLATQVQWAITTAKGQQTILTGNNPLPLEPELGASVLKAVQEQKSM